MASGTTMTDDELVAYIIKVWSDMANTAVPDDQIPNYLGFIHANGINMFVKLVRDNPQAQAFRARRS